MRTAWLSQHHGLRVAAASAALAVLTAGGTATAQEASKADLAKARTLFQEGVALAAANNCAAALVKYKEVAQVRMSPQVAFNTAECEARLGKLVSALGNYRVAASQAADDKRATGVLKEVPARIDDLEARIPKLTITRSKGGDTATIELDGSEIGSGQLGSAIPVDPGPHQVIARVGTKQYLRETVTLAEKENKTFEVKINISGPKIEVTGPEPVPGPDQPAQPPAKSRAPGIAVTVVGGVVLVTGLAMLGPRGAAVSKLGMDCNASGHCPTTDQDTASQGKLFTGLTEVMVPVGVVTAVVGIVLIARSGPQKAKKEGDGEKKEGDGEKKDAVWRSLQVVASSPGASVGGLSLKGRF